MSLIKETETVNIIEVSTDTFTCSFGSDGIVDEVEEVPENNEIWYTSSDGNTVTGWDSACKGASSSSLTIISNTYINGKGVVVMSGDIDSIIGHKVRKLYESCLSTNISNIILPSSITSIGEGAFNACSSLTSVTIPNSVTSIENVAFMDCTSLTSVTIPNSVTSIGMNTFYCCTSLTSVIIPNSVTSIGTDVFMDCISLTSITIPSSVTSIGNNAFMDCTSLTSITIPSSVTSIGNNAFSDCTSMISFTCESITPPTLGSNAFSNVPATMPIYVPSASVDAYKAATNWSERADYIQAIPE